MDFPLEDTVMNIYLDDSMFQKSYQAAGSKLTRELFRKYYDTIYKFTYLDQVSQIFRHIPLDSLKSKNEVTKEYKDKNEPCTRYYTIHKEQDEVTLTYGTNSNIDYVDKKGKSPDHADVAGCEYSVFWIFKFDGNKLRLVRQTAAG